MYKLFLSISYSILWQLIQFHFEYSNEMFKIAILQQN